MPEPAPQSDRINSENAERLPRVVALETYVRSVLVGEAFWREHFGLMAEGPLSATFPIRSAYEPEGEPIAWRLLPGAQPCGTRGPHGLLPSFRVDDFGQARGYLLARKVPIVFEEILPGLKLLVFLDPDGTPIQLAQPTDPTRWDIAERRLLRMRRRIDAVPPGPLRLGPLDEITIYTPDITASVAFYRDLIGLPVGLSFFGHIHLVMANAPLVLRGNNRHCKTPGAPHATELVLAVPDADALLKRLHTAGYATTERWDRFTVVDPAGWRLHLIA
jgi:catechol 2,3-dioxygenase-like lactoylglutathione lyase family enzyme